MSNAQIITLLEFSLKMPTSFSMLRTMNRFKVQPWVPPLALSLLASLWKSLKSRPLVLPPYP